MNDIDIVLNLSHYKYIYVTESHIKISAFGGESSDRVSPLQVKIKN